MSELISLDPLSRLVVVVVLMGIGLACVTVVASIFIKKDESWKPEEEDEN